MRLVLFFFVTLVSVSVFAQQPASENAQSITSNGNGSVTVIYPQAYNTKLQLNSINYGSDLDGVCRLFGFSKALTRSVRSEIYYLETSVVDSYGAFVSSAKVSKSRIRLLECTIPMTNDAYFAVTLNPGGSITIVSPKFGNSDFARQINSKSDLNGVCKYFGYGKNIGDISTSMAEARTVVLSKSGHFGDIVEISPLKEHSEQIIDLISCTK